MKKITLFFLMALMCSFTAMAQFTFPLDTGMYQTTGPTPIVVVAVNDAGNAAGVPGVVYDTFTVTYDWSDPGTSDPWSSEEALNFTTTAGTTLVDPPTSGGASSGASTTLTFSGAIPGGAYDPSVDGFLELGLFRSYSAPADITNISVTIFPVPTCTSPAATAVAVDNCGSAQFSIDVDVTSLGDATSVTISNNAGVAPTTVSATGMVTVGPFPAGPGGVVDLTLEHDQDNVCNVDLGSFDDSCTGLPPITSATFNLGCAQSDTTTLTFNPGNIFWVEINLSGGCADLTVDTNTSTGIDSEVGLYDATGALIGNDDDGGDGLLSLFSAGALADGTYYMVASAFNTTFGATDFGVTTSDTSTSGNLVMTATSGAVLSTSDIEEQASFSYYPNPVNNTLTLNAQNNIENVRMYNMLGQEVMNVKPQTLDSELDLSRLETGTYFVQVTIVNVTKTVRVVKQ
ncbi:T9SS type A sorting domain-containing protein [Winogradskyella vincentii]|uniref:T9SS type A sorting domain-containing protein n=1 Tax=Winogradskyella vincentii TaxID=2877122 RepID=A0ABS7Y1R0_9FLAO|nr:T9SS type A sorting domain-containing protein [Winogradskyella vincentii]MCA0152772.1 T9SS type A sorting domain-containing protein [Winogradskyella vincentii]